MELTPAASVDRQLQVGVKIWLRDVRGRYLLVRRSTDVYADVPASWDIPGGRINIGDELLVNLAREIKEETGLSLNLDTPPVLLIAQDIIRPNKHVIRLTYVGSAAGEIKLDSENVGYCWMTLAEIQRLSDLDEFAHGAVDAGLLEYQPQSEPAGFPVSQV